MFNIDKLNLSDATNMIESRLKGPGLIRLFKTIYSVKKIMNVNDMLIDYEETIPSDKLKGDLEQVVSNQYKFSPKDLIFMKYSFALGLYSSVKEKSTNRLNVIDFNNALNDKAMETNLKLIKLAEQYVNDILESRHPVNEVENKNMAIIDLIRIDEYSSEIMNEYIYAALEKEPKWQQPDIETGPEVSKPEGLTKRFGNFYLDKTALGKNLFSFAYAFGIFTATYLGLNLISEIPIDVTMKNTQILFQAAYITSLTNMLFPATFQGTGIKDTLTHTPGMFLGYYGAMSIFL